MSSVPIEKIIKAAVDRGASDLHIKAGDKLWRLPELPDAFVFGMSGVSAERVGFVPELPLARGDRESLSGYRTTVSPAEKRKCPVVRDEQLPVVL